MATNCEGHDDDFHGLCFPEFACEGTYLDALQVSLVLCRFDCPASVDGEGTSDKAGGDEGGRADARLSSEEIRFRSINIDGCSGPSMVEMCH